MGYILKLILFIIVFSWIIRIVRRLIFTFLYKKNFNQQQQRQQNRYNNPPEQERKVPETQEERILDLQRKKFESTDVEDVDFEEIK